MNDGLIASRYAGALLTFAKEEHASRRVYDEAETLRQALSAPDTLAACIEGLSETMKRFLAVVIRNKRTDNLSDILRAFRIRYRKENGIVRAWLTTATEDPSLEDKLTRLMKEQGLNKIDFKTEINPNIIGGFVIQIEDKRLDASISSQIKQIRKDMEARIRKTNQHG